MIIYLEFYKPNVIYTLISVFTNLYVTESLEIGTINILHWPLLTSAEYVTIAEPVELTPVLEI